MIKQNIPEAGKRPSISVLSKDFKYGWNDQSTIWNINQKHHLKTKKCKKNTGQVKAQGPFCQYGLICLSSHSTFMNIKYAVWLQTHFFKTKFITSNSLAIFGRISDPSMSSLTCWNLWNTCIFQLFQSSFEYLGINHFICGGFWAPACRRNQVWATCEEHTDCHKMYGHQMHRNARKKIHSVNAVFSFVDTDLHIVCF